MCALFSECNDVITPVLSWWCY